MKRLELVAVGGIDGRLLGRLALTLGHLFHVSCATLPQALDPTFALHKERQQFHSSEILRAMQPLVRPGAWRVLGVTTLDLYIPILTFVFGEAQMGGPCGLVSGHRLRQEFYGLPLDDELFFERLVKEAVHELGHTLDLTHCDDYECAMAPSHGVEWIDLKGAGFCEACQSRALSSATL